MTSTILNTAGMVLLVLGGVTYLVSILLITLCSLSFRIFGDRKWEERATLMGVVALTSLPAGGCGGSLLLANHLSYQAVPHYDNLFVLIGAVAWAVLSLAGSLYLIRDSSWVD